MCNESLLHKIQGMIEASIFLGFCFILSEKQDDIICIMWHIRGIQK